jgi:hypothetical protein
VERAGVYIHFARVHIMSHEFDQAHSILNNVTNEMYTELKNRVARSLEERQTEAQTNQLPSEATAPGKPAAAERSL